MTRCDMRSLNECDCEPTRCAVQPQTTPAPVPRFTVRDQLMVCAFIGVIAGIATFAVAARSEPYLKTQDQIAQEVTHHAYRR